jgi:hypothetical protein
MSSDKRMDHSICRDAWKSDSSRGRASSFDLCFPDCCCEAHSLKSDAPGVGDRELIARIFTTPESYNQNTREVVWNKLVRAFSDGLSMFRSGCSEGQIRDAVEKLTRGGAENNELAGVALIHVEKIRKLGNPSRWFCIYDTESDEFSSHTDLIATRTDPNLSRSKQGLQQSERVRALRDEFTSSFVFSSSVDDLIDQLRARDFEIVSSNEGGCSRSIPVSEF